MSHIDREYARTRMSRAEERAYEKEHECHRKDCDSPVDETSPCMDCGKHFCCAHLYGELCADCFEVQEQVDELCDMEDENTLRAAA